MRKVRSIVGLVLGALLAAAPSFALTVDPGGALLAPFSLTAAAPTANTLTFRLVNVVPLGVATMTVELYDGATLLASVSGVPVNGIAAFVDAGSLWTTNAVAADLSSVRSGSIAGSVRVIPAFAGMPPTGALTADVSTLTSFAVGLGTDASTINPLAGVLSVGTASVVPLPEPESLLLLLLGAALLPAARSE